MMHGGSNEQDSIFSSAVTEFLLVMVFILLLLLTYYFQKNDSLKEKNSGLKETIQTTLNVDAALQKHIKSIFSILTQLENELGMSEEDETQINTIENNTEYVLQLTKKLRRTLDGAKKIKKDWSKITLIKKQVNDLMKRNQQLIQQLEDFKRKTKIAKQECKNESIETYRLLSQLAESLGLLVDKSKTKGGNLNNEKGELITLIESEIKKLADHNRIKEGQLRFFDKALKNAQKQCGTGPPVCLGGGEWVAHATLKDTGIYVVPRTRITINKLSEPFKNMKYTLNKFNSVANKYLDNAKNQRPPCRYIIKVTDKTSSKRLYKKYMKAIEQRFYKIEKY